MPLSSISLEIILAYVLYLFFKNLASTYPSFSTWSNFCFGLILFPLKNYMYVKFWPFGIFVVVWLLLLRTQGNLNFQESVRLLVLWVLPCLILKTSREVMRMLYVHHESWWQTIVILFAFVLSSTYVTIIFLSSCILFYLVCNLQIIHFDDYGKLLDRHSDVLVLIQEHIRLRHYLSKISHRFRIYLILVFLIVTVSQFVTLFQTTGYPGMITFINGGDFAVSLGFITPYIYFVECLKCCP